MSATNTKNIVELEAAFNKVMSKWNLGVYSGIVGGDVKLEDSLPWFEVYGELPKSKAKQIVQDLANEMNIKVLLNRYEVRSKELTIYGVFDINNDFLKANGPSVPLPALSDDPDSAEYMADYGDTFVPKI